MRVEVRVIRDGSDLLYVFAGEVPQGLESFDRKARGGEFYDAVIVRGPRGERMPLLAAEDWLRDRGVEPVRVRDAFASEIERAGYNPFEISMSYSGAAIVPVALSQWRRAGIDAKLPPSKSTTFGVNSPTLFGPERGRLSGRQTVPIGSIPSGREVASPGRSWSAIPSAPAR